MDTDCPALRSGMTLAACVRTLLEQRVLAMPVVDDTGVYIGHFRKNLLISALLPQVAVHDQRFERITRMIDTGLLDDTMADVCERFALIANDLVDQHLDKEAPTLRPDQPLVIAMFYLYLGRNFLPVVDPKSGLLVGLVSAWHVLENIIKQP